MLLAGIQAEFGLDPRLKHSGVTVLGVASLDPSPIFEGQREGHEEFGYLHRGDAEYRREKNFIK
jgi:hypothetical protein